MKQKFIILFILIPFLKCYAQTNHNSYSKNFNVLGNYALVTNSNSFDKYSILKVEDTLKAKSYFLERRKKFNKTGWDFLSAGLTISVINLLFIPTKPIGQGGGPTFEKNLLTVLGFGGIAASIPYFISAHNNKVKALNFGLKNEQVKVPLINGNFNEESFVAIRMSLSLNVK